MEATIGFSQILSSLVELFGYIYTAGYLLFNWLSTPLIDSVGDGTLILGDLATYTPLELMFGPAIIIVLVLAIVKFAFVG